MQLSFKPFQLEFKYPFGVSSNTRTHTPVVFTKIESLGFAGYGEANLPPYLGETQENTMAFLEKAALLLKRFSTEHSIEEILLEIDQLSSANNAAKAAIDIALHDLTGKMKNIAVSGLLGIPTESRLTSATIGISDEASTAKKIEEAKDFSILKIKAGTQNDKALVNLVRKYTDKPLYIDVNQGWTDPVYAIDMIHWLSEQNVILVEQPMPVSMPDEMAKVTEASPLPTIADESVKRLHDIEKIKGCFSGINIKLMKCTGLNEAMKMIESARKNGLKILLGCMSESSCAASAMAQLMAEGDYIDLDGPDLIKNDPFAGIRYKNGKVLVPDAPGTAATLLNKDLL